MEQNLKQTTLDNLTKAQSVLVAVAESSGTGGLAAGLATYLSCQKLGKNVSIMAKSPTVDDAQKLYGVDSIGKTQGSSNLVVVVKNAVETVDRVSHYLDGDQLKLTLHAFPGTRGPSQEDVSFSKELIEPDVIFAIGFESEEALKKYITHAQNISPNCWLINITHRDTGQIFAQVNVFDEGASGLSEITANLISDLALPVDEDIAFNLYHGISQDTNNFSPAAIGPRTFEMASWLIKFGAGHASFAGGSKPKPAGAVFQPFDMTKPLMPQFDTQLQQQTPQAQPMSPGEITETPINQVEREKTAEESDDWLNPPKIYQGSKTFDSKE